jgi:hypothetical protein
VRATAVLLLALLAGCAPAMTNDQVIAEVQKCEKAGMRAVLIENLGFLVTHVQCRQKRP